MFFGLCMLCRDCDCFRKLTRSTTPYIKRASGCRKTVRTVKNSMRFLVTQHEFYKKININSSQMRFFFLELVLGPSAGSCTATTPAEPCAEPRSFSKGRWRQFRKQLFRLPAYDAWRKAKLEDVSMFMDVSKLFQYA